MGGMVSAVAAAGPTEGGTGGNRQSVSGGDRGLAGSRLPSGARRRQLSRQDKVMSLLLNMLSRLVITFLPSSKHLLISWLQLPSAVILEPTQNKV